MLYSYIIKFNEVFTLSVSEKLFRVAKHINTKYNY